MAGVLQADPTNEEHRKCEVKETFVRNGENDESGRTCQEDDKKSVHIVVVGLQAVRRWHQERCNYGMISATSRVLMFRN